MSAPPTSASAKTAQPLQATFYALGAIALWVSLASLGVALKHLPPFLLTGAALVMGGALALPQVLRNPSVWRVPPATLALGVYGLFGYHFMLFMALRLAPPVEANLINYLWPLLMVVLAPVLLPGMRLKGVHVVAALLGFSGAAVAILGAGQGDAAAGMFSLTGAAGWGYAMALAAAFMWSSYSLLTQRVAAFSTAAIGLFALVSGVLALACHGLLEEPVSLSAQDWLLLALTGLGPLGGAFFLWDKALKLGDARQIGILSYLTPLGSTALLMLVSGRAWSWSVALAALLIMAAAVLGTRARA
jgi:drug/metabolite transporter (DMT)-like permease